MGVRKLTIAESMLFDWFTEGRKVFDYTVAGGIPVGAKLTGMKYSSKNHELTFILFHEDWPESDVVKELQLYISGNSYEEEGGEGGD